MTRHVPDTIQDQLSEAMACSGAQGFGEGIPGKELTAARCQGRAFGHLFRAAEPIYGLGQAHCPDEHVPSPLAHYLGSRWRP
jgi:hypothetical protein